MFLLRSSSPLQTVCMETVWRHLWMCRAISWLLAWELLSLLTQEVAQPQAERSGRTQRARQSCGIPCSGLMSCACCRWGWLRALLHGGSGRPDQATALVGPWPWLSQMGFIQDTCLAWSLFSFPFEERRSHGRGVTERLSRLSWTRTSVPNELLLRFPRRLWRLQPKGQEATEKELQPVCQRCRIRPGWERDCITKARL